MINHKSNALRDWSWKAIGSFWWAVNVHIKDIHEVFINEFFHRHTATATTLNWAVSAWATQIIVTSATWITVWKDITLINWIELRALRVTVVSWTTITLDRPLDAGFSSWDDVVVVEKELNTIIWTLSAPIKYVIEPDSNQLIHIHRLLLGMTHASAWDLWKFGWITGLTNWVVIRKYYWETWLYATYFNWKTNWDMKEEMYDVDFDARSWWGWAFGTSWRCSIDKLDVTIHLDWSKWDFLEVLVQDDLTWLDTFEIKGQWHIEWA